MDYSKSDLTKQDETQRLSTESFAKSEMTSVDEIQRTGQIPVSLYHFITGLPRARSARGTEPHAHRIWFKEYGQPLFFWLSRD